ncbi:MAG: hypothetical protein HYU65_08425, partial [Armatimonadetes bacterium]|nr:hypothetical protein [Armatimonadota bacterium]
MALSAASASAQAALPSFETTRLYSEADFAATIRPYTEAIARNANDAQAHHWLGIAYLHIAKLRWLGLASFGQDALARAISSLERAMRQRPRLATLMPLLDAYMMAGDMDKWRVAIDRSFTLAPPLPLK